MADPSEPEATSEVPGAEEVPGIVSALASDGALDDVVARGADEITEAEDPADTADTGGAEVEAEAEDEAEAGTEDEGARTKRRDYRRHRESGVPKR